MARSAAAAAATAAAAVEFSGRHTTNATRAEFAQTEKDLTQTEEGLQKVMEMFDSHDFQNVGEMKNQEIPEPPAVEKPAEGAAPADEEVTEEKADS
mgnify:CR=1 FL=1